MGDQGLARKVPRNPRRAISWHGDGVGRPVVQRVNADRRVLRTLTGALDQGVQVTVADVVQTIGEPWHGVSQRVAFGELDFQAFIPKIAKIISEEEPRLGT